MNKKYEYTAGIAVHPAWGDRSKVPVPPQKVRERLRLPARYALATLSSEVADTYPKDLYANAMNYLRQWPEYLKRGMGPMFVGAAGKGTSWTAAALANEIVMRSEGVKDMTMHWLSCFWMLRLIQDHRELKSTEAYQNLRTKMMTCQLLVVDDILAAKEIDGGLPFMHTVYAHRYDTGLPTITTVTTINAEYWREIQNVYGRTFTDRLKATTEGLVARVN